MDRVDSLLKRTVLWSLFLLLSVIPLAAAISFNTSSVVSTPWNIDIIDTIRTPEKVTFVLRGEGLNEKTRSFLTPLQPHEQRGDQILKTWGSVRDVEISGPFAFFTNGERGIHVAEIHESSPPEIIASLKTPGKAWDIAVKNGYCLVADVAGLRIIDAHNLTSPSLLASIESSGEALGITVEGDLAILSDGTAGIKLIDISKPEKPVILSALALPGCSFDAWISDSLAYVACGSEGISIVDISHPKSPRIVNQIQTSSSAKFIEGLDDFVVYEGTGANLCLVRASEISTTPGTLLPLPSSPFSARIDEGLLYVTHKTGVSIFGLDDPGSPVPLRNLTIAGYNFSCNRYGETLLVANGHDGLRTIPLTSPSLLDSNDLQKLSFPPLKTLYSNDLLFVGGTNKLEIYDWPKGSPPELTGALKPTFEGRSLSINEGRILIGDNEGNLYLHDITNPSNLAEKVSLGMSAPIKRALLRGNRALIVSKGVLYLVTFEDKGTPMVRQLSVNLNEVSSLNFDEERICLTTSKGKLLAGVLSKDNELSSPSILNISAEITDSAMTETTIYLALSNGELIVVDSSDIEQLKIIGRYPLAKRIQNLFLDGNYLVVDEARNLFHLVDVHDPQYPRKIGEYKGYPLATAGGSMVIYKPYKTLLILSTENPNIIRNTMIIPPNRPIRVCLEKSSLCYIDSCGNVSCTDVENSLPPKKINGNSSPRNVKDILIRGRLCYLAEEGTGIKILDISEPQHPRVLGETQTPGSSTGLALDGAMLYVADGTKGIAIVDVKDPENPHIVKSIETEGDAHDIALKNGIAYIANGHKGTSILDLSDLLTPRLLDHIEFPWPVSSFTSADVVEISGERLYVLHKNNEFQIFDLSDPRSPLPLSHLNIPGSLQDIQISGEMVFIADSQEGIVALDVRDPSHPRIIERIPTIGGIFSIALGDGELFGTNFSPALERIPLPLEPLTTSRSKKGNLSVTFPLTETGGEYRLTVFNQNGLHRFSHILPNLNPSNSRNN